VGGTGTSSREGLEAADAETQMNPIGQSPNQLLCYHLFPGGEYSTILLGKLLQNTLWTHGWADNNI